MRRVAGVVIKWKHQRPAVQEIELLVDYCLLKVISWLTKLSLKKTNKNGRGGTMNMVNGSGTAGRSSPLQKDTRREVCGLRDDLVCSQLQVRLNPQHLTATGWSMTEAATCGTDL